MKVTMIVLNSVWHDPRVRRTATSAFEAGFNTTVLGEKDDVYDSNEVDKLPFNTILLDQMDKKYYSPTATKFTKIKREFIRYKAFIKACIKLNPDLIHANDLYALPIAYFTAKKTGSKIVYDSHEICTENIGISDRPVIKFIFRLIEHFLIKRVDKIVTVSQSSSSILSNMYKIKPPLVIRNAVFKINESNLREKRKDRFEVLYHGKFYRGRGYEAFIRSAALLKKENGIQFVLRGLGDLELELRKLAVELKLEDKLRFDPPVLVTDLAVAASSSHVGLVLTEPINLNFINTLSNKLFEYINAGLPVILSDVPEHRFLNSQYDFGLVIDAVTPEKISEAIMKLYCDKALYEKLCINAKNAAKLLNWDIEVQKLITIYEQLCMKIG